MADLPISGLTPITTPATLDEFATNQSGASGKSTRQQVHAIEVVDVNILTGPTFTSNSISLDVIGESIVFDLLFHSSNMSQAGNTMSVSWAGTTIASFVSAGNVAMVRLRGIISVADSFGPFISALVEYDATTTGGTPFTSGEHFNGGRAGFDTSALPTAGTLNVTLTAAGSVAVTGYINKI